MFKMIRILLAIQFSSCIAYNVYATELLEKNEKESSPNVRYTIKEFIMDSEGILTDVDILIKKDGEKTRVKMPAVFSFIGYHHDDDALVSSKVWGAKVSIEGKTITASMEVEQEPYTVVSKNEKIRDVFEEWTPVKIRTIYKRPGNEQGMLTVKNEPEFECYVKQQTKTVGRKRVCMGEFKRFTQGRNKLRHKVSTYEIDEVTKTEWRRPIGSDQVHENMMPYKKSNPEKISRFLEEGEGPECGDIQCHGQSNTPNDIGVKFSEFLDILK